MNRKPSIGVTGPARGSRWLWWFTRFSLWLAGRRAVPITTATSVDVASLDGLVIGGGDDIGAEIYKGDVTLNVKIDPARDRLELDCLAAADRHALPVLGICRGAQMLNVSKGGNLTQDVYSRYADLPRLRTVLPRKRVRVNSDSPLGRILGVGMLKVNALHHQAIERLGDGLKEVARDGHGIIQGIEATGPRFMIGVQWHPELLPFIALHRRLFAALVTAAKDKCS